MSDEQLVGALAALAHGDRPGAERAARAAADDDDGPLALALAEHLAGSGGQRVYDQPAAFNAFVGGGGNIGLYESVAAALGELYQRHRVTNVLDVGVGEGTALLPALQRAAHRPVAVDLVEPSAALLDAALARLARADLDVTVRPWQMSAQDFVAEHLVTRTWSLAQSTFALQSLPPSECTQVLRALRPHIGHLAIVEFDVPDLPHASGEHLASLVARYQRGLGEYDTDRDLVAQGFLMPMLTSQFAPDHDQAARTNWEHTATIWQEQVEQAGYEQVTLSALDDYWFAPAFLLTARGGA